MGIASLGKVPAHIDLYAEVESRRSLITVHNECNKISNNFDHIDPFIMTNNIHNY